MGWRMGALALLALSCLLSACTAGSSPVPNPLPPGASNTPAPTEEPGQSLPADCVNPLPDLGVLIEIAQRGPADPCFGGLDLTIDAYWLSGGAVDCPARVEPAFLYCPADAALEAPLFGSPRPKLGRQFLLVAVHPASGIRADQFFGIDVRVTGHFDDPAAQTCHVISDPTGSLQGSPVEACRRTFVVTRVVLLGP